MKSILALLIFTFAFKTLLCQSNRQDTVNSCPDLLNEISYYWKLDSLANNGFRLVAHNLLLNCKIGNIYRGLLLDKLGNPNRKIKTNKGEEYVYYYYDYKKMPQDLKNLSATCDYIIFYFGEYEKYASKIYTGHGDYGIKN